jgi:TPR repeat protein
MYERGEGVARDDTRAAQLYQKACDGGYARGCFEFGRSYAAGRGVAKDEAFARQLFQKACDGGDMGGCAIVWFANRPDTKR